MSGLDLQDHLAMSGLRIPVIVVSGFADEHARARAFGAGPFVC